MEIDTKSILKDFQEELSDSDKYYEIGSKMRADVAFSKKLRDFSRCLKTNLLMHVG